MRDVCLRIEVLRFTKSCGCFVRFEQNPRRRWCGFATLSTGGGFCFTVGLFAVGWVEVLIAARLPLLAAERSRSGRGISFFLFSFHPKPLKGLLGSRCLDAFPFISFVAKRNETKKSLSWLNSQTSAWDALLL